MKELIAHIDAFIKAAEQLKIADNAVAYIHPSLINDYNHKCYTWEQLWLKIQHNKNAKKLREVFNIK